MQIKIEGNAELRRALRRFTPDLEKALKKEIRAALLPVVKQARGFVPSDAPLSGWQQRSSTTGSFPQYNGAKIQAGINFKTTPSKVNNRGFSSMASIFNASRVGSIYESAGRANPQGQPWVGPKGAAGNRYSHSNNPKAGQQFIDAMPPLSGSLKGRGRLIFRAWALNQGRAEGAVLKAISTARQELVRRSRETNLRRVA
jgi:hypothetical protein